MQLQAPSGREQFGTNVTIVRFNIHVRFHMTGGCGFVCEAFVAAGTLVRFLPRVDSEMSDEIGRFTETLRTIPTFVGVDFNFSP
jgi:hypothetical protein